MRDINKILENLKRKKREQQNAEEDVNEHIVEYGTEFNYVETKANQITGDIIRKINTMVDEDIPENVVADALYMFIGDMIAELPRDNNALQEIKDLAEDYIDRN